jgi:hypothetical protein
MAMHDKPPSLIANEYKPFPDVLHMRPPVAGRFWNMRDC